MRGPTSHKALLSARTLDLTNQTGWLCGRILADLGAEVIKVERPGGDADRNVAPFYRDKPQPERSLYWMAYNAGKKGITLNLETARGRDLFMQLASVCDLIVETFPPGYMREFGIGYESVSHVAPHIIVTSITPFGQTGSKRDYKASDITLMALAGVMATVGRPNRVPLRLPLDQSYNIASANAAMGSLIAYHERQLSGMGQHVDISIYECLVRFNYRDPIFWEFSRTYSRRSEDRSIRGKDLYARIIWPCQDGYVTWMFFGGQMGAREIGPLIRWMKEETIDVPGIDKLSKLEQEELDFSRLSQDELMQFEDVVAQFFARHGRKELQEQGMKRGLTVVAVNDIEDVLLDAQLSARGFWMKIEDETLGEAVSYPGHWFISSETENHVRGRAPYIGEHNEEIYEGLLGLSQSQLESLRQDGTIGEFLR